MISPPILSLSLFAVLALTPSTLVSTLYRYLINSKDASTGWCLELLYRVCEDLRNVAQLVRLSPSRPLLSISFPLIQIIDMCERTGRFQTG